MPFQASVSQELVIDGVAYRIAEHPAAPGMPYGQEGRQAVVYQVIAKNGDRRALKVFKPRFRAPALVGLTDQLAAFADLPGLSVCRRAVLTPRRHTELLRQQPDLTYAVLMPWIEGPTWMEVVLEKQPLPPEQSLRLARGLAGILAEMEERGLAHCDLSGPNVLLPLLAPSPCEGKDRGGGEGVALVDVEQMFAPGLNRPQLLASGSSGYAHSTAPDGLWAANADRFAGAVLLAEMLGWCDAGAQNAAWGESYFDPAEVQQDTARYRTLLAVLRSMWGEGVASLFERAWHSDTLADCGTFGEWLVALPDPASLSQRASAAAQGSAGRAQPVDADAAVYALMDLARRFAQQSKLDSALETYRQALALPPRDSGLARELTLIVADLEARDRPSPPASTPPERPRPAPINRSESPVSRLHTASAFDPALDRPGAITARPARRSFVPLAIGGLLAVVILAAIVGLGMLQGLGPLARLRQPTPTPVRLLAVASPTPITTSTVLTAANVGQLSELARWEQDTVLAEGRVFGWSPRGRWFTVRSTLGLRLYDGETFNSSGVFSTGAYPVISPDEKLVASAEDAPGMIRITDMQTGQKVREWQPHQAALTALWFAGDTLFSRDQKDTITASDFSSDPPRELLQMPNMSGRIYTSADGKGVIAVALDSDVQPSIQKIRTCDIAAQSCRDESLNGDIVLDINENFTPENGAILTLSAKGEIGGQRYDTGSGDSFRLGVYTNTESLIYSSSLSPHGLYALVGDDVWRVADQQRVLSSAVLAAALGRRAEFFSLRDVTFSPNDRFLAGTSDPFLADVEGKQSPWVARSEMNPIRGGYSIPPPAFRPDDQRVAWGMIGAGGKIEIFDTSDGRKVGTVDADSSSGLHALAFDNHNDLLTISTSALRTRALSDGTVRRDIANPSGGDFALTDNGIYLRSADSKARYRFIPLDPAQPEREVRFDPPPTSRSVVSMARPGDERTEYFAFSHDDRYLALEQVSADNDLKNQRTMIAVYDATKPQPIATATLTASLETNLAFSPDDSRLAVGLADHIELLRVSDLGEERRTPSFPGGISTFVFSPNGQLLAISASPDTIYLWQLADGALYRMNAASESVGQLTFTPDGSLLAVVVKDAVQLWDVASNRLLRSLDAPYALSVAFSPDQTLLAVGSRYDAIYLWCIK